MVQFNPLTVTEDFSYQVHVILDNNNPALFSNIGPFQSDYKNYEKQFIS